MFRALGIDVDPQLHARWRDWYAPGYQLFRKDKLSEAALAATNTERLPDIPLEVRDTFGAYDGPWVRIAEADFRALPRHVQVELLATRDPDERDLFRWPTDLADEGDAPLLAFLNAGASPSRHAEVSDATWATCRGLLPHAHRLAGTFATRSGPNCYATVMAAAGEDVEDEHVGLHLVEAFLRERTVPADNPDLDRAGVVILWRRERDEPHHA